MSRRARRDGAAGRPADAGPQRRAFLRADGAEGRGRGAAGRRASRLQFGQYAARAAGGLTITSPIAAKMPVRGE